MFEQTLSFPCPSCKEIINDRAEQCKYCGAPIDKAVAQFAAEVQSKVNQAYSDASYLKTAAFAMFTLLAISLLPFVPFVFYGAIFIFLALIVMIVRWQLKFANINTADPDYQKARRNKNIALALWVAAIPGFILRDLIFLVIGNMLR
ncbi:MAG TPA: zinc ribbon domain-containing protein [Pyrinomonadaceae bacterium]|nr:zinc ribbon domain-containing protein [Pyrinomonadaceae bacterium]